MHDAQVVWSTFLIFLRGLTFAFRWTATMERSLRSSDTHRVHLHAFLEFRKAVDWVTLAPMQFFGSFRAAVVELSWSFLQLPGSY